MHKKIALPVLTTLALAVSNLAYAENQRLCFFNCDKEVAVEAEAAAQTVWEGDALITSNEQAAALAGYEEINGNLEITGNVTDLTGLESLKVVHGDVKIHDTLDLENINNFDSLQTIDGNLFITKNLALKSVNSFNNLNSIGGAYNHDGNVYLYGNELLTDVNGFNKLTTLNDLIVTGNFDLEAIEGFKDMATVTQNYSGFGVDYCLNLGVESAFHAEVKLGFFGRFIPNIKAQIGAALSSDITYDLAANLAAKMNTELASGIAVDYGQSLITGLPAGASVAPDGGFEARHEKDFEAKNEFKIDLGLIAGFGAGLKAKMNMLLQTKTFVYAFNELAAQLTAAHGEQVTLDIITYMVADMATRLSHDLSRKSNTELGADIGKADGYDFGAGYSFEHHVCFNTSVTFDVATYLTAGIGSNKDQYEGVTFSNNSRLDCGCTPDIIEPPVDEPPVDEPPADEPPADEPPADEPPADEQAPPIG